jgi:hypothetical protein
VKVGNYVPCHDPCQLVFMWLRRHILERAAPSRVVCMPAVADDRIAAEGVFA